MAANTHYTLNTPSGEGIAQHAVRFSGGTVTDLNIPGASDIANATATGINDSGVIIGIAQKGFGGATFGVLPTPTGS